MQLSMIASFLIAPGKNLEKPPEIKGTFLPSEGNIYQMLGGVFDKADEECNLPIRFIMAPDGKPSNPARDLIIEFIKDPSLPNGKILAERLRDVTTKTPGLGLLFILLGYEDKITKFVLSRFPADQGILAEATRDTLALEFIERVFMKNASSYKAALYKGGSFDADFWSGSIIDKQLKMTPRQAANYWIRDFLASDFETTSKAGTKRFAIALRNASRSTKDASTQHELVATSMLVKGLAGKIVTIQQIFDSYNLSKEAREVIISNLAYPGLANDAFLFDRDEFISQAAFASIELNTGGILLAPPDLFEDVFQKELINPDIQEYRFTTSGRIVDEKVRGRK